MRKSFSAYIPLAMEFSVSKNVIVLNSFSNYVWNWTFVCAICHKVDIKRNSTCTHSHTRECARLEMSSGNWEINGSTVFEEKCTWRCLLPRSRVRGCLQSRMFVNEQTYCVGWKAVGLAQMSPGQMIIVIILNNLRRYILAVAFDAKWLYENHLSMPSGGYLYGLHSCSRDAGILFRHIGIGPNI